MTAKVTRGVVANVLDCDIEVSKFEPQSPYDVPFQTITIQKGMNSLIHKAVGWILPRLSFLQRKFWHWITHEVWYIIEQRNQTKEIIDVNFSSDLLW